ncbi:MAG: four helix bundle protein [Candidatus Magasanikbacteria bacterium]|nr:four helix bundle protein [Candidatus Magasanikbacteria bacterium]
MELKDLFVYKISLELCDMAWEIYHTFDWQIKKIIGDQFIRAVDSNAANIVEGYGRYHYLDKIKFYYNARASLMESKHWCILLSKRKLVNKKNYDNFLKQIEHVHYHLNNWINVTYKNRDQFGSDK